MNLLEALARVLGVDIDDLPEASPYDEGSEQRIAFVADTYDPDTGRSRPLRPRRDRPKT